MIINSILNHPNKISVFVVVVTSNSFVMYFAVMSTRSYYDGDMKYAEKWADHAFMIAMATLGITIILAVAIGFTLSNVGTKGGHAP